MSDNDNDELESKIEPTEEVEKTEDIESDGDQPKDKDVEVLEEKNKKLFERAKKAEAENKELKAKAKAPEVKVEAEPSQKQDGLSPMDTIALIDSKVTNKEDIEVVMKYAKLNDLSIGDALKDDMVKSILKDRLEKRTSAEVTNTNANKRGANKPTGDQLLDQAQSGKTVDDMDALADARLDSKRKK